MSEPYQGYTRDMTEQEVREAFVKKYGYEPKEIIRRWDWLAGPVRKVEEK